VKIAQIAPLYESVPPKYYGGTERIVSYLTEELVRQGHDVTLFASGDSKTSARLVSACRQSLRLDASCQDPLAHHVRMLERVARDADQFEILHFHVDYLHYPWSRRGKWPHLTTLHGCLEAPDLEPLYDEFAEIPIVSISAAQRRPLPCANWQGTVHHGLPVDLYEPPRTPVAAGRPDGYLAFVGRISREKRVDRAIAIAEKTGWPLRIAAKVDRLDRDYFEREIAPLFDQPFVTYLGEIGEPEKRELLGHARALLFPIDWSEPFGLVMIEAMACGTPVIAWRGGSVDEIITPGLTGFVVDSLEEAVDAVERVGALDRLACRQTFEERFTVQRMAGDYLRIYQRLIERPVVEVPRPRRDAGWVA
jgi:glycosyltransferase involved in cell wall biosynthesis